MKRIALLAVDSTYPNLALMKLSAYHKGKGDSVEWYDVFGQYDILYMAKVFTFTPDWPHPITNVPEDEIVRGGTGYDVQMRLPDVIDRIQPDYSIYPSIGSRTSYGFLTRGCIRRCPWCIVPRKEGGMAPYMDVDEIAQHGERPNATLMDNNILAATGYAEEQLEKIARRGYRIDFNQGLDARLVDGHTAELLARCRWQRYIRFGCDTPQQVAECERAIALIREHGYKGEFFLYCILQDLEESYQRISHWRGDPKVLPFAQPYREFSKHAKPIPQWQKDMACWADRKQTYKTCDFKDFSPRKGFTCAEYF